MTSWHGYAFRTGQLMHSGSDMRRCVLLFVILNKLLNKQSTNRWLETQWGVKWRYCVTRNLFIPHGIIHNIIIRNISIHLHSYRLDEFYGLIFTACVKNWTIIDELHAPTTSQTHNNYVFIMLYAGWVDIIKIGKDTGPRLNIKTVLSTYGDFHVKDKTAVRTSYL